MAQDLCISVLCEGGLISCAYFPKDGYAEPAIYLVNELVYLLKTGKEKFSDPVDISIQAFFELCDEMENGGGKFSEHKTAVYTNLACMDLAERIATINVEVDIVNETVDLSYLFYEATEDEYKLNWAEEAYRYTSYDQLPICPYDLLNPVGFDDVKYIEEEMTFSITRREGKSAFKHDGEKYAAVWIN